MDLQLKDKIALVTGSTSGIGFAIAKALAKEGSTVYINGRSKEKVEAAIHKIQNVPGKLKAAPFDLSDKNQIEKLIQQLPEVDILINNLGMYQIKDFKDISDDDWLNIFNVNVLSGIRLCRHYFPLMLKKNWGRVLFISSESGINIPVEMIHYGMTKSAQLSIARGLAEMTAGTAVTVNSLLPGPTYSEGLEEFIDAYTKDKKITKEDMEKELFKTARPSSLLKRFATVDEVGEVAAFICSPLASAINGAPVRVEGGIIRSIA